MSELRLQLDLHGPRPHETALERRRREEFESKQRQMLAILTSSTGTKSMHAVRMLRQGQARSTDRAASSATATTEPSEESRTASTAAAPSTNTTSAAAEAHRTFMEDQAPLAWVIEHAPTAGVHSLLRAVGESAADLPDAALAWLSNALLNTVAPRLLDVARQKKAPRKTTLGGSSTSAADSGEAPFELLLGAWLALARRGGVTEPLVATLEYLCASRQRHALGALWTATPRLAHAFAHDEHTAPPSGESPTPLRPRPNLVPVVSVEEVRVTAGPTGPPRIVVTAEVVSADRWAEVQPVIPAAAPASEPVEAAVTGADAEADAAQLAEVSLLRRVNKLLGIEARAEAAAATVAPSFDWNTTATGTLQTYNSPSALSVETSMSTSVGGASFGGPKTARGWLERGGAPSSALPVDAVPARRLSTTPTPEASAKEHRLHLPHLPLHRPHPRKISSDRSPPPAASAGASESPPPVASPTLDVNARPLHAAAPPPRQLPTALLLGVDVATSAERRALLRRGARCLEGLINAQLAGSISDQGTWPPLLILGRER